MIINEIINRAKTHPKTIILPEIEDERIQEAAKIIEKEHIAKVILLGNKEIDNIEVINPLTYQDLDKYVDRLYEMRKEKGLTKESARELLLTNKMYFACMLVLDNKADGIVSGACHTTGETMKPALELIKSDKLISTFFLIELEDNNIGENGTLIMSDCGLNQNPDALSLSKIAIESGNSFLKLLNKEPRIAMLSYSTHGSSKHPDIDKVIEATKLVKENSNYLVDGEIQLDVAIIPEISTIKCPDSPLKGTSNVLIFPDLNSGNISYKIVERIGKAKAYGPLTQGIKYPVNDLSRGCSVSDIVGVVAITVLQSIK